AASTPYTTETVRPAADPSPARPKAQAVRPSRGPQPATFSGTDEPTMTTNPVVTSTVHGTDEPTHTHNPGGHQPRPRRLDADRVPRDQEHREMAEGRAARGGRD